MEKAKIGARMKLPKKSPTEPCKNTTFYSWNINGLRAVLRKGALQDFLKTYSPDFLCLQEIKCKPSQLTPLELVELEKDYKIFWHPAEKLGYSGTATLVSRRIQDNIALVPQARVDSSFAEGPELRRPAPWDAARAKPDGLARDTRDGGLARRASAKEAIDCKPCGKIVHTEGRVLALDCPAFFLVNVYVPNSKPDLSRLSLRHDSFDPGFRAYLKSLEETKPVIVCGDFNAAHEEIDLARPKANRRNAGFTDEEREGVTNLMGSGFLDTFRSLHPDEQRYSWWSHWGHARENNVGWRIDYFLVSKSLKNALLSADIHESVLGSDHCPVSITLKGSYA